MRVWPLIVIALGLSTQSGESPGALRQAGCAGDGREVGDDDLYCIELLPAGGHRTRDRHRTPGAALVAVWRRGDRRPASLSTTSSSTLRDLPAPGSLGRLHGVRRVGDDAAAASGGQARGGARTARRGSDASAFDRFLDPHHGGALRCVHRARPAAGAARHVGQRAHAAARSGVSARGAARPDRTAPAAGHDPHAAHVRPRRRAAGRRRRCTRTVSMPPALHDAAAGRLVLPAGRAIPDSARAAARVARASPTARR